MSFVAEVDVALMAQFSVGGLSELVGKSQDGDGEPEAAS